MSGIPTIDPTAPGIVHADPACDCLTKKPETDAERVAAGLRPAAAKENDVSLVTQPNACWYKRCRDKNNQQYFAEDQFHSDASQLVGCNGYWDCSINIAGDLNIDNIMDDAKVTLENNCGANPYRPDGSPCKGADPNGEYVVKNTTLRRDCVFSKCKPGYERTYLLCAHVHLEAHLGSLLHDTLRLGIDVLGSASNVRVESSLPHALCVLVARSGALHLARCLCHVSVRCARTRCVVTSVDTSVIVCPLVECAPVVTLSLVEALV